jgi:hypothetical protein
MNRISVAGIAASYGLEGPGFSSRPDRLWGLPRLLVNEKWGVSPGVKWRGSEVNNSLPSSAEINLLAPEFYI